ncbi:hypothetical protein GCM10022379_32390 [Micromonospora maritima]
MTDPAAPATDRFAAVAGRAALRAGDPGPRRRACREPAGTRIMSDMTPGHIYDQESYRSAGHCDLAADAPSHASPAEAEAEADAGPTATPTQPSPTRPADPTRRRCPPPPPVCCGERRRHARRCDRPERVRPGRWGGGDGRWAPELIRRDRAIGWAVTVEGRGMTRTGRDGGVGW